MKRLIAVVLLLSFVAISYLSGYFYIKSVCSTANDLLKECVTVYETDQNATDEAEKLKEFWDEKEKMLSVFANHSSIDEIESAIHSVVVYSDSPDNKIFDEYSGTVKTLLHQLMEDTVPSIHSIM